MTHDKEGYVRLRSNKTNSVCIDSKPLVPSSGRLLEAIERFVQAADIVRMRQVKKTWGLLTVDLLVKCAM
jgi:hypothetical protein